MTAGSEPEEIGDLSRPDSVLVDAVMASPNHDERTRPLDSIILHYTGMANGPAAIAWLRNPAAKVSSHYVIEEDGRILQLVAEARRAWHAGRSFWQGETDFNSASVGIEIVNDGHAGDLPPYPEAQVDAVMALCRDIAKRRNIARDRVLGHSDIAPGRKQDPGERFPWQRLHEVGLGLWVPARPDSDGPVLRRDDDGPAVRALQSDLQRLGFDIEPLGRFDAATETAVRAFQLHYRASRVDGIADEATVLTLADLLRFRDGTRSA